MGRDESEEECQDRRARDRRARDVHRAYDRHRRASDALDRHRRDADDKRREADDWRAEDRKLEEDRRRAAEDLRRRRAEDRRGRAEDVEVEDPGETKAPPHPPYDKRARDRRDADDRRRRASGRRDADDRRRAEDEPPPFEGKPEVGKGPPAMDEAAVKATVAKAIAERDQEHRLALEAREFVRPIVGSLPMALDTASEIYKAACKARGISINDVHPSAYRALLDMHRQVSANMPTAHRIAQDTSADRGFNERFPEVGRVIVQG